MDFINAQTQSRNVVQKLFFRRSLFRSFFTMKAVAVFPKTQEVKVIDNHEEPQITEPTQVKLRMLDVGVCGTDKEICSFEYGTPPDGSDYLVIGHESLGEVIEVGANVS